VTCLEFENTANLLQRRLLDPRRQLGKSEVKQRRDHHVVGRVDNAIQQVVLITKVHQLGIKLTGEVVEV